jgi:hypothetical protein
MPEPPDYEDRWPLWPGPYLPNFHALDELFDKHHPPSRTGTWRSWRSTRSPGRGLGSALMRRRHEDLDRENVRQYLEATDEHNVRLYRRTATRTWTRSTCCSPTAPPFYRMWRPALA